MSINANQKIIGTVSVGKPLAQVEVSEIDGGHKITVTDPDGIQELTVLDGVGIVSVEQTVTSTEDGGNNEVEVKLTDGQTSTLEIKNGSKGDNGDSAYELAVKNGFEGTEEEWLESLKGKDSDQNITAETISTALGYEPASKIAVEDLEWSMAGLMTGLTKKVNKADIINDLTSDATDKPLAAAQGKALKASVDNLKATTDIFEGMVSLEGSDTLAISEFTEDSYIILDSAYHISDVTPTLSDFSNGCVMTLNVAGTETPFEIPSDHIEETQLTDTINMIVGFGPDSETMFLLVLPEDNVEVPVGEDDDGNLITVTFEKKGIYALIPTVFGEGASWVSLQIPNYDGLGEKEYVLTDYVKKEDFSNGVVRGECTTIGSNSWKEVTLQDASQLKAGNLLIVHFENTNTVGKTNIKLEGQQPIGILYNGQEINDYSLEFGGEAGAYIMYFYDGTNFIYIGKSREEGHRIAYGTCSGTGIFRNVVVADPNFKFVPNTMLVVYFENDDDGLRELSVNDGDIHEIRNVPMENTPIRGVIKAGDIATFIHSNNDGVKLISVNRCTGGGVTSWNDLQDKPFGEEIVMSDTLVWDGDMTDMVYVEVEIPVDDEGNTTLIYLAHISDTVPTIEDFKDGGSYTVQGITQTFEAADVDEIDEYPLMTIGEQSIFIIKEDNADLTDLIGCVFPKKGVYFIYIPMNAVYVSALTINNYTGLERTEIKTLDPKYIGDGSKIYFYGNPISDTKKLYVDADKTTLATPAHIKNAYDKGQIVIADTAKTNRFYFPTRINFTLPFSVTLEIIDVANGEVQGHRFEIGSLD